jgi:hypothetical protein
MKAHQGLSHPFDFCLLGNLRNLCIQFLYKVYIYTFLINP